MLTFQEVRSYQALLIHYTSVESNAFNIRVTTDSTLYYAIHLSLLVFVCLFPCFSGGVIEFCDRGNQLVLFACQMMSGHMYIHNKTSGNENADQCSCVEWSSALKSLT